RVQIQHGIDLRATRHDEAILVRKPDNPAKRAVVAISGRLVLALDVRQAVRGPEPEKLIGLAHAVLYDRSVILPSGGHPENPRTPLALGRPRGHTWTRSSMAFVISEIASSIGTP